MPQRVDHPMDSPIDTIAILLIYLDMIRPSIVDAILNPLPHHHRQLILQRIREFGSLSPDDIHRHLDQLAIDWTDLFNQVTPLHRHFSPAHYPPTPSTNWATLATIPIPQLASFLPHTPFDIQILILQSLPTPLQASVLASLPDTMGPPLLKGLHHPRPLHPSALLTKIQDRIMAQIQQHSSQAPLPVLASLPYLPSNKRIKWLLEWEDGSPGTLYEIVRQSFPFNARWGESRLFERCYPLLPPEVQRVLRQSCPEVGGHLPIPDGGTDPPLEGALSAWWSTIVREMTETGWDPWE